MSEQTADSVHLDEAGQFTQPAAEQPVNKDWVPKPIDIEPDQVLNFTQGIRKEVVLDLVSSGVPQDSKDRSALLETLRDMDKTSLSTMKLNHKERELDIGARTQIALQRLTETLGATNPMEVTNPAIIEGNATRLPSLSLDTVPTVKLVEGETTVGIDSVRYEQFMAEAVEKGIAKPMTETKDSAVPVQSN